MSPHLYSKTYLYVMQMRHEETPREMREMVYEETIIGEVDCILMIDDHGMCEDEEREIDYIVDEAIEQERERR